MERFTVLVTAEHLVPEAQEILRGAGGRLEFMTGPIDQAALIGRLSASPVEAVLMRGSRPFTQAVLDSAVGLRVIAKNGAGVDSVDLHAAARRGIQVAVARGANADAVAEHAVALMLSMVRGLPALDRKVRAGGWEGTAYLGRDFRGSTVGIVGFGSIGRSTAHLATALGAKVLVFGSRRDREDDIEHESDFEKFLGRIDILSLHCPLNEQTRGMVGRRELAWMRPGALLVNTARGAVVDEAAMVESLRSGHLGGAGLDTFEHEPLATGSPLFELDNVVLTPHVAGVTRNAALRVATMTAKNIVDALAGRPLPRGHLVHAT